MSPIARCRAALALAATLCVAAAPAPAFAHRTRYLLSLGDSLAVGVQPDGPPPFNETDQGYADQLFGLLRAREPGLALVKLGCSGESARSMREGSLPQGSPSCGPPELYEARYPQGTQLATAEHFLRTHRGEVALVTIDVGSNDLTDCIATADPVCVDAGLRELGPRVAAILHALRRAGAGRIVGMTYYDPLLGAWLGGPEGQAFARASNDNVLALDALLARTYRGAGARVADVAGAFHIDDFDPHGGALPLNIALACRWTWFCTPPPLGPNVHANADGYGVIARAFAAQVPGFPWGRRLLRSGRTPPAAAGIESRGGLHALLRPTRGRRSGDPRVGDVLPPPVGGGGDRVRAARARRVRDELAPDVRGRVVRAARQPEVGALPGQRPGRRPRVHGALLPAAESRRGARHRPGEGVRARARWTSPTAGSRPAATRRTRS